MSNYFPDREIEGKITLYPGSGTISDLQAMVRECINALCCITVSVSGEMTGVTNNPVHRFGGTRRFRIQGEKSITLELGGRKITYPVWGAVFKHSEMGDIGEREAKIHIASFTPPQEVGTYFISPEHGTPVHLGQYLKTKMGHDVTTKSGRTFHICVDKCVIPGKDTLPLYQIEVEYKYSSDGIENETLAKIQAEIDEIIRELSSGITIPHVIGGPKKGKWFSESMKQ